MTANSSKRNKTRNVERNSGTQDSDARIQNEIPRTTHDAPRTTHAPWAWAWLMALALVAYLPALGGEFLWDDDVLRNLSTSWDGLAKIWTPPSLAPRESHYWPLVYTSFWLEGRLWGSHPFGHHLINILLHGLCGVLLWRVLRKLDVPGAWIGAALFVVHPVHVESVAWVIERKDVLSGALFFGAILAYLRFEMRNAECGMRNQGIQNTESRIQNSEPLGTGHSPLATRSAIMWYALALVLSAGALLSKSIVVGLPLVLAMVAWWRRGRLKWRDAALLAPFALLAIAATAWDFRFTQLYCQENMVYDSGLTWAGRVLLAARAVWFYLLKLVWPHPLAPFYPKWDVSPANPVAWLPLVAGVAGLAGLWAARLRIGRGPLAAALFFIVMLAPVLGFIDHGFMDYSWVADRFQYLASAGPLALAGMALARVGQKGLAAKGEKAGKNRLKAAGRPNRTAAAVALTVLGLMCFVRATRYHDSATLYSAAAEAYPQCWGAHYLKGVSLVQRGGDPAEGFKSLDTAQRLHPTHFISLFKGQVQMMHARYAESEASFQETLRLMPGNFDAHCGYGELLDLMGRQDEALAQLQEALRLKPNSAKAMGLIGTALKNKKDYAGAEKYFREAARWLPAKIEYRKELGLVLALQGKHAEAAAEWEQVLWTEPNNTDTLVIIAHLKLQQGLAAEAAGYVERALALNPRNPNYHNELGRIQEAQGKPAEAAKSYQKAIELDPGNAAAAGRLKSLSQ